MAESGLASSWSLGGGGGGARLVHYAVDGHLHRHLLRHDPLHDVLHWNLGKRGAGGAGLGLCKRVRGRYWRDEGEGDGNERAMMLAGCFYG